MEVGAVKQAFNNELILLKKKLNQAKIQIIHKLTRKAKTFTEKKAPEPVKEKLKRKAESAVNEVLIIKKIKPKDLARFAVTHKGQLNDYLNKPNVNQEKACARLLLHKSLQDKYKLIRTRFCSIPIEDLLMSREERKKLKKEEKEKQKNKRKGKENKAENVVNAEGVWEVENMDVAGSVKEHSLDKESDLEEDIIDDESQMSVQNSEEGSIQENNVEFRSNESDNESNCSKEHSDTAPTSSESENKNEDEIEDLTDAITVSNTKPVELKSTKKNRELDIANKQKITNNNGTLISKPGKSLPQKNQVIKSKDKSKSNKNKNLNEKLLSRTFKKDSVEAPIQETKIVDPFFITSTGENYLSVVEPRPPDEVKEVHKQGNRKLRRAAMFGHVPKIKPRQHVFKIDDSRFDKHNGFSKNNNSNRFNNKEDFSNDKRNVTNKRNKFESNDQLESKPEKLHPSWEAKKRQSGIQPFKGKKIVFDEN